MTFSQAFLSFLPEIDLEWGDLDPNVQQKLRYSQQAGATTESKKRPFEEQCKPLRLRQQTSSPSRR